MKTRIVSHNSLICDRTPESIVPADFLDLLDKESVVASERNPGFIESDVAERVGFEPTVGVNPQRFSRP